MVDLKEKARKMKVEDVKRLYKVHLARFSKEWPFLSSWQFDTDNARRRAGACHPNSKTITISKHHIQLNDVATVEDTLLHEIAHAICFETIGKHNHGIEWKRIARLIGAQAKASGSFNTACAKWMLVHVCPKSREITPVTERFRRNKRIRYYHLKNRPDTKGQLFYVLKDRFDCYMQGGLSQFELEFVQ